MTSRALSQPFETVGNWWLPEAPDRPTLGVLHYTPGHTRLGPQEAFTPVRWVIGPPTAYGGVDPRGMREPEHLPSTLLLGGGHVLPDLAYPRMSFTFPACTCGKRSPLSKNRLTRQIECCHSTCPVGKRKDVGCAHRAHCRR